MNFKLNNKKIVTLLKEKMKDNKYDYLLNWSDDEYSWISFYDYLDENVIKQLKDGWHIIIAINGEKEGIFNFDNEDYCLFIQIFKKNNQVYDTYTLTDKEIDDMMIYFFSIL